MIETPRTHAPLHLGVTDREVPDPPTSPSPASTTEGRQSRCRHPRTNRAPAPIADQSPRQRHPHASATPTPIAGGPHLRISDDDGQPHTSPGTTGSPHRPTTYRAARLGATLYFLVVLAAVTWPAGDEVASFKGWIGPWFLDRESKDVILNLTMLFPLMFLCTMGWPRIPWWAWFIAGCALSCGAELIQLYEPLDRRASWANVVQNIAGAWAGTLTALALTHRRSPTG